MTAPQPVPNAWHYGPTPTNPDPGRRWHYGCGGEVLSFDGGEICGMCGQQWDGEAGVPVPGTGREPALHGLEPLAAFLRERYTEQCDAIISKGHTLSCSWTDPCYEPPYDGDADPTLCDCPQRARLADVDAKLAVVAECADTLDWEDRNTGAACADKVLRLLALPFAGHSQYQEGWRP